MTLLEKGAYIELLMLQFARGKFTLAHAKHMLAGNFDQVWPALSEKFKTDGTFFWNDRLMEEKEKRVKYTESRRDNAINFKTSKKHMPDHMQEHMINRNIDKNKDLNIEFKIFWDLYDKKEDRAKCEKKWANLSETERELCIIALPEYIKSTPDKQFRRHPSTYLNNKSWENEIIKKPQPEIRSLTYAQLLQRISAEGSHVNQIYKPVMFPGKEKPLWVHIDDIKSNNLKILEK